MCEKTTVHHQTACVGVNPLFTPFYRPFRSVLQGVRIKQCYVISDFSILGHPCESILSQNCCQRCDVKRNERIDKTNDAPLTEPYPSVFALENFA